MRFVALFFALLPSVIWGTLTTLSSNNFSIVRLATEGALIQDVVGEGVEVTGFKSVRDVLGNTLSAWAITNGSNTVLQAAFKPSGGNWQVPGSPTVQNNVLSPLGFNVLFFEIDLDENGNAVVAWEILNGPNTVVQAAYKPFGGRWQTPGVPTVQGNVLSPLGFSVISPIDVAIGGDTAVVVWEVNNLERLVAQAAVRPSGGTFQNPGNPLVSGNILSSFFFNLVTPPTVAVDTFGNAAVAWQINNLPNNVAQLSRRPVGGSFSNPGNPQVQANIISQLGINLFSRPEVTIVNNSPIVQWLILDGANLILQAFD